MAVDIGVARPSSGPGEAAQLAHEPRTCLFDDGYYWFLYPFWVELRERTGQYVDLYGNASFSGAALDVFRAVLAKACKVVRDQPESWRVHTGTHIGPVRTELYETVYRAELLRLLDTLSAIAARAAELGGAVECSGD
jgi:hypothetical protein